MCRPLLMYCAFFELKKKTEKISFLAQQNMSLVWKDIISFNPYQKMGMPKNENGNIPLDWLGVDRFNVLLIDIFFIWLCIFFLWCKHVWYLICLRKVQWLALVFIQSNSNCIFIYHCALSPFFFFFLITDFWYFHFGHSICGLIQMCLLILLSMNMGSWNNFGHGETGQLIWEIGLACVFNHPNYNVACLKKSWNETFEFLFLRRFVCE